MGCRTISKPGVRLRRHDRHAAARRRRRTRRQAVDGRAGPGWAVVPRRNEEPVEPGRSLAAAQQFQRLLRRSRLRDGRRPRRLLDRDRNARVDHLAVGGERRHRVAADLRPCEPVRRDGAQLDDGQDRTDVPDGRGLRARVQCHLRARWPRRHRGRCALRLGAGRSAGEAEDWLHQAGVRGGAAGRTRRRRAWRRGTRAWRPWPDTRRSRSAPKNA